MRGSLRCEPRSNPTAPHVGAVSPHARLDSTCEDATSKLNTTTVLRTFDFTTLVLPPAFSPLVHP